MESDTEHCGVCYIYTKKLVSVKTDLRIACRYHDTWKINDKYMKFVNSRSVLRY